jgi:hypothetical protein
MSGITDYYSLVTGDLKQAGCNPLCTVQGGNEKWFSPVNNCNFLIPHPAITSRLDANSALRRAGLPARF